MKNSLKKFMAILLACVMVFAMTATVFATSVQNSLTGGTTAIPLVAETTGKITISGDTNKTYQYFKIASIAVEEGNGTYTYTVEPEYINTFKGYLNAAISDTGVINSFNLDNTQMKQLATALETIVKDETGIQITAGASKSVDLGYYLIVEKENTDALTCTQPILVAVPQVNGESWAFDIAVTPKSSSVSFEKKIVTNDQGEDNKSDWLDTSAEAIGDTITYVLKSSIPQYDPNVNKSDVTYKITDTPSEGLTVNDDSVHVYVSNHDLTDIDEVTFSTTEGVVLLSSGNDYSYASGFSVDFTGKYEGIDEYKYVYIFFDATLNENAVVATESNPNSAKLNYSNDYDDVSQTGEITDKVDSFTFEFDLLKTAVGDSENTPLAGAKFELKKGPDEIILVKEADGNYRVATVSDQDIVEEIETVSTGKITIKGLDEGTYTLVETVAPAGYKLYGSDIEFEIDAVYENHAYTGVYTIKQKGYPVGWIEVEDEKGITLPGTGGIGTTIFTIGGIVLVLLAAVMFIVYMRRQKEEQA